MSDYRKIIDSLYKEQQAFALYHLPNEKEIHLLLGDDGSVQVLKELSELEDKEAFLLIPFQTSAENPQIAFYPKEKRAYPFHTEDVGLFEKRAINFQEEISKEYTSAFDKFLVSLKENKFEKLVLARTETIRQERELLPSELFLSALSAYPQSYTYIAYIPMIGLWLGASPEVFLKEEGNSWETTSLAGTQSIKSTEEELDWSDKNKKEQAIVTNFIEETLNKSNAINVKKNARETIISGNIAHLQTNFSFQLREEKEIFPLIESLFPTPAVCGLPQKEARDFICQNEDLDRSYYSGIVGYYSSKKKSCLFVNIRCLRILQDEITLFAGGGLLSESNLNDEFLETERKLETMKQILSMCQYRD